MDDFSPPLLEYAAIKELVPTDQWICWRGEDDQGNPWIHGVSKNKRGDPDKPKKVPYRGNHKGHAKASSTGPTTWTNFAECCAKTESEETFWGIGFVLTDDDPYAGGDLDACRDPKTGKIDTWAQEIIDQLDTYTEVSPRPVAVVNLYRSCKNRPAQYLTTTDAQRTVDGQRTSRGECHLFSESTVLRKMELHL